MRGSYDCDRCTCNVRTSSLIYLQSLYYYLYNKETVNRHQSPPSLCWQKYVERNKISKQYRPQNETFYSAILQRNVDWEFWKCDRSCAGPVTFRYISVKIQSQCSHFSVTFQSSFSCLDGIVFSCIDHQGRITSRCDQVRIKYSVSCDLMIRAWHQHMVWPPSGYCYSETKINTCIYHSINKLQIIHVASIL